LKLNDQKLNITNHSSINYS